MFTDGHNPNIPTLTNDLYHDTLASLLLQPLEKSLGCVSPLRGRFDDVLWVQCNSLDLEPKRLSF